MKLNILEKYPNFSHLYHRVLHSKKLKDILEEYGQLPDLSNHYDEKDEFLEFDDIDDNFLKEVDQIVIDCRNNENYFDEIEHQERIRQAEMVTNYINKIIKLICIVCRFTNKIDLNDISNKVSGRLSLLMPNNLKKMIKISSDINLKKQKYDKIKSLVKIANELDLQGKLEKANKVDDEINNIFNKL